MHKLETFCCLLECCGLGCLDVGWWLLVDGRCLLAAANRRTLAAGCPSLFRGCRVGVPAFLSAGSHTGAQAFVPAWARCSALGCLPVLGLVVVDARSVGAVFVPRDPTCLRCARRRSGPRLAGGGVGAGTCEVRAGPCGDAGHWGRPVVDVVVAVALLFKLLVCVAPSFPGVCDLRWVWLWMRSFL
jgi:hypothetical protein